MNAKEVKSMTPYIREKMNAKVARGFVFFQSFYFLHFFEAKYEKIYELIFHEFD